ncbi:MAG: pyridoxamine 5'-phosphate oxidase family protein [Candidatus Helarchaeota archaeon]
MQKKDFNFDFIEKQIRKKTFGILSTVSPKGRSQSSGILYGVAPPNSKFSIYLLTSKNYKKVENIENNPHVSFVVPFPHYWLRFAPSSTIYFQGTAELVPIDAPEPRLAFGKKKILKGNLEQIKTLSSEEEPVFIKIKPNRKIFCYGLGVSLLKMAKEHNVGGYSVNIPENRL